MIPIVYVRMPFSGIRFLIEEKHWFDWQWDVPEQRTRNLIFFLRTVCWISSFVSSPKITTEADDFIFFQIQSCFLFCYFNLTYWSRIEYLSSYDSLFMSQDKDGDENQRLKQLVCAVLFWYIEFIYHWQKIRYLHFFENKFYIYRGILDLKQIRNCQREML